jgi:hypothetical protein
MVTSKAITERARLRAPGSVWGPASEHTWWTQHREATLNWLALGMLLAAWNATDEDTPQLPRRPDMFRGYAYVSVRAATLNVEQRHVASTK